MLQAILHGDKMPNDLDLVDLYLKRPQPTFITLNGDIDVGIVGEATQGVTFTREEAFLRLPRWDADKGGKISLKFRTVEPDGLMLYNGGSPGVPDFIAVEMFDGIPYLVIDLGDGVHRYPFSEEEVNDGVPHYMELERRGTYLKITLDGRTREYNIPSNQDTLNLGTFLFLGGVDSHNRLPWHLWSWKPVFYQGCMWDLQINTAPQDLRVFAENQPHQGITDGCVQMADECMEGPCVAGICNDLWDGYSCDCAETRYTGQHCEEGTIMLDPCMHSRVDNRINSIHLTKTFIIPIQ